MIAAGFDRRKLAIALAVGVAISVPLLAVGLWASLLFATVAGGSRLYWAMNWAYVTLGLVVGLTIVRWHSARFRWLVAGALLLGAALVGLVKA